MGEVEGVFGWLEGFCIVSFVNRASPPQRRHISRAKNKVETSLVEEISTTPPDLETLIDYAYQIALILKELPLADRCHESSLRIVSYDVALVLKHVTFTNMSLTFEIA